MTTNARAPENNIGVRQADGWTETTTAHGTWRLTHRESDALLELMPTGTRSLDRDSVDYVVVYRDGDNASGQRINEFVIGDKDIAKRRAREWAVEHSGAAAPSTSYDAWGMVDE